MNKTAVINSLMDKLVQRWNYLLQMLKYTWDEVQQDEEFMNIRSEIKKVKAM